MRIRYVGLDNRTRIAVASRVKFMSGGYRSTDKASEVDESFVGPLVVAHIYYAKGGKRITMEVPDSFDMEAAKQQLLEKGWLDLSACKVRLENLY